MGRSVVNRRRGPNLDELAQVHHPNSVGDVPDDAQVMRDDDVGQVVSLLKPIHQVENL